MNELSAILFFSCLLTSGSQNTLDDQRRPVLSNGSSPNQLFPRRHYCIRANLPHQAPWSAIHFPSCRSHQKLFWFVSSFFHIPEHSSISVYRSSPLTFSPGIKPGGKFITWKWTCCLATDNMVAYDIPGMWSQWSVRSFPRPPQEGKLKAWYEKSPVNLINSHHFFNLG